MLGLFLYRAKNKLERAIVKIPMAYKVITLITWLEKGKKEGEEKIIHK
jgi:hypothetical protein